MNLWRRLFLTTLMCLGTLAIAGCPTGEGEGEGEGEVDPNQCRISRECAAGSICDKAPDDEFGLCVKVLCLNDSECDANELCDLRRGLCLPDNLCDPSNPGDVCGAGQFCVYNEGVPQCLDEGELDAPAACDIEPANIVAHAGEAIVVAAAGSDASGSLVPYGNFTFTATGGTISGNAFTGECATGVCEGVVTATSGGTTCTANAKIYAAVGAGDSRVVLVEQATGNPIAGAPVAAKVGATLVEGTTDADGQFTFAGQAAPDAVSAFPASHQWQTVVGPTNDTVLYTVAVPDAAVAAGVKGEFDFDKIQTEGEIRLGLAGMSLSNAITDLDFNLLIGEIAQYDVEVDGITDPGGQPFPLPSGLVLELGTESFKGDFVSLSEPGKRTLWALGGKVRISQIGDVISTVAGGTEDINFGSLLTSILPFFSKFSHSVVSGLEVENVTRPPAPADEQPIPYADWNLQALDGANAVSIDTLLSQSTTYTVPRLPCAEGASNGNDCDRYQSGTVLLSGVAVPGQGIVPLGLTAGLDVADGEAPDGQLDYNTEAPAKGEAIIDYAPPHDGLEGNDFFTIAIAVDIDGLLGDAFSTSVLVHGTEALGATNSFPGGNFLELQGGTWAPGAGTFTLNAVGNADFYRLNFNEEEAEWNVWIGDAADANGLDINSLRPAGVTGRDIDVDVQAFRLGTGGLRAEPANFGDLTTFNGTNFGDFLYYMGAWSSTFCRETGEDGVLPHCARQP